MTKRKALLKEIFPIIALLEEKSDGNCVFERFLFQPLSFLFVPLTLSLHSFPSIYINNVYSFSPVAKLCRSRNTASSVERHSYATAVAKFSYRSSNAVPPQQQCSTTATA